MAEQNKLDVFLICPVRRVTDETKERIRLYVENLEQKGVKVHWPLRDTEQNDPTGGFEICRTNFRAILDAREIHIWYDKNSDCSKLDMGGVFMIVEMLGAHKKIIIVNDGELVDNSDKSILKIVRCLAKKVEKRREGMYK